jgi:hypothetical protein
LDGSEEKMTSAVFNFISVKGTNSADTNLFRGRSVLCAAGTLEWKVPAPLEINSKKEKGCLHSVYHTDSALFGSEFILPPG